MSIVTPPPEGRCRRCCGRRRGRRAAGRARANSTAATTSPVSSGWIATAGVRSIMPFQSRVASANRASPGLSSRPFSRVRSSSRAGGAALAISGRRTARNSSGRSTGGSAPQSSIISSGQPKRSRARSAIAMGVASAWRPQTRVVGTRIAASSSSGIAGSPSSPIIRPSAARRPGMRAVDVVRGERRPQVPHFLAQALQVEGAVPPKELVRALARLRHILLQRGPEVRRRVERGEAERIDQHQRADAIAVAGGEASRDGAAEGVTDEDGGDSQVRSISWPSQAISAAEPCRPSTGSDARGRAGRAR